MSDPKDLENLTTSAFPTDKIQQEEMAEYVAKATSGLFVAPRFSDLENQLVYRCVARHQRETEGMHCFDGEMWSVRVPMPDQTPSGAGLNDVIRTPLGLVQLWSPWHSLRSVSAIRKSFPALPEFSRVDMITTARYGTRFAPVSLFLCYDAPEEDDTAPVAWLTEVGTAFGRVGNVYAAERMDQAAGGQASYMPTPFSRPDDRFIAMLTMANNRDPDLLDVIVKRHGERVTHVRVQLRYEVITVPLTEVVLPARAQYEAAVRMAAIMAAEGATDVDEAWVKAGLELPWIEKPSS
jgi:hypothetical protein